MVTWDYYSARRLKDVQEFLAKNKCYDYETFCEVLKSRSVIAPPREEIADLLPAAPRVAPPRLGKRLADVRKKPVRKKRPVSKPTEEKASPPEKEQPKPTPKERKGQHSRKAPKGNS